MNTSLFATRASMFRDSVKLLHTAGRRGDVAVPVCQLPSGAEFLGRFAGPAVILADRHTQDQPVISTLKKLLDSEAAVITVECGEHTKSLGEFNRIKAEVASALGQRRVGASSVIAAVGGGTLINVANAVLADLAGTGISMDEGNLSPDYTHYLVVPSTILAIADVALGSKGNINSAEKKHAFRSYYEPSAIVLDPRLVLELPKDETQRGLTECLKHCILHDNGDGYVVPTLETLLTYMKNPALYPAASFNIAVQTMYAKASILGLDPHEQHWMGGLLLSYGHLHAHAWEEESGFKVSHGDSVLFGLLVDLKLAGDQKLYEKIVGITPYVPLARTIEDFPPSREGLAAAYALETKPFSRAKDGSFNLLPLERRGYYTIPLDTSQCPVMSANLGDILDAAETTRDDILKECRGPISLFKGLRFAFHP